MRKIRGLALLTGIIAGTLLLGACSGLTMGLAGTTVSATPAVTSSASPTAAATGQPTADQKSTAIAEAQEWVRQLVSRFEGVETIPEDCRNWQPSVDLTIPFDYFTVEKKESPSAFGPGMGATPCEIARNMVERAYRYPRLAVAKANSTGVEPVVAADAPAKVVKLTEGSFADRRALANKLLAWYADPARNLTIVRMTGPYMSDRMVERGGTIIVEPVLSNRDSTVLVTKDHASGTVLKEDRMNCDWQDHGKIPSGQPIPKPGQDLEPKVVTQDPASHGNAGNGGGGNATSGPRTYIRPQDMKRPSATPRPSVTLPTLRPTSRPTVTAEPSVNPSTSSGGPTPRNTGTPTRPT